MDGTTEPVVAVIGYPVAGNPTQFALETGFAAAAIDCRVLSIGLSDDVLADALQGMLAMRFRGVWIDATLRSVVTDWIKSVNAADDQAEGKVQSLVLDESLGTGSQSCWRSLRPHPNVWTKIVAERRPDSVVHQHDVLLIGENDDHRQSVMSALIDVENRWGGLPSERIRTFTQYVSTIATDDVGLVILTSHISNRESMLRRIMTQGDVPLVVIDLVEDWQSWRPMTLALSQENNQGREFLWIDAVEIHAAMLVELCKVWLQADVPADILRDAIEEYLAM